MWTDLFAATLAVALFAPAAEAVTCDEIRHGGNRYTICEVDAASEHIALYLTAPDHAPYGDFDRLEDALASEGKDLLFAMNAGMYHIDRDPVGHYVENGQEKMRVIASPGPGNFGLLPNGIFCIRPTRADVFETRDFLAQRPDCQHATQSGPMLVIDGALHPRFIPDSSSRYIRNGVGTSADGRRVVFAISENAVNFYDFGRLFRDALNLPNALFLDGNISRLYARSLNRKDLGRRMGPIVAVTRPATP